MRVRMLLPRRFQDVGAERMLDRGAAYELPDAVAQSLIATGAAVEDEPLPGDVQCSTRAPETRVLRAPERKLRRVS